MILLKFSSFVSSTLETATVFSRPVARNPGGKRGLSVEALDQSGRPDGEETSGRVGEETSRRGSELGGGSRLGGGRRI